MPYGFNNIAPLSYCRVFSDNFGYTCFYHDFSSFFLLQSHGINYHNIRNALGKIRKLDVARVLELVHLFFNFH